jgi:predicted GNAT family N-acyltransferase
VFVHEQQVPVEVEWDGLVPDCVEAVAETVECDVIGTGRLQATGKIGRMAVLADWRGRGVGAALLRVLMDEARSRGLAEVYLNAQSHVVDFYARYGFGVEGEEFEEAGIPHRRMRCRFQGETMPELQGASSNLSPGTRTLLGGREEFAEAVAMVSSRAQRALAIFTPRLEPGVYDTPQFIESVKRLVLSRSHARIRVLISDAIGSGQSANRFLFLGRRLSTFIEFRELADQFQDRDDAFLIADDNALVYRARSDRWEGILDTDERRMARMYLEQFDLMWQSSENTRELRELRI